MSAPAFQPFSDAYISYTPSRRTLKSLAFALTVATLLTGCRSTQPVSFDEPAGRAQVNDRARHGCPAIALIGQTERQITALHIAADLTTWIDRRTGEIRSAPTSSVEAVTFRDDRRGALKGAEIGIASGVVLGSIAGASNDDRGIEFSSGAFVGGFGFLGGLIGALSGALGSDRTTYRVEGVSQNDGDHVASPVRMDAMGPDSTSVPLSITTCWRTK